MNPFVYGEAVNGENFCNRKYEIKELLNDALNGQNVMLYSPRRYGKTSLVKEVLKRAQAKGLVAVYVDLYPVLCEKDFVEFFINAIGREMKGYIGNTLKKIKNFFRKLSPRVLVGMNDDGKPTFQITLDKRDILPAIEDVCGGLYNYLKTKKKKGVVVFDEFQQIASFQTDQLEKKLRAQIQTHRDMAYIFMGSKKHLIFDIFNNPNRPFYKSTKHFPLEKIQEQELNIFIKEKFSASQKKINDKAIDLILETTQNHPYYTQFLCHVIWDNAKDKVEVSVQDVTTGIDLVLKQEDAAFSNLWENLTVKQKQVIVALAKSKKDDMLFSSEFLQTHGIGSVGSMQRALQNLLDRDLIEKEENRYSILDLFFQLWILKKF